MSRPFRPLIVLVLALALLLSACIDEQALREFEAQVLTEEAALKTQSAVAEAPPATRTPRPPTAIPPTRAPAASGGNANPASQTWTVMLYQNADDEVLEADIFIDLNEAERVGSTDRSSTVRTARSARVSCSR